MAGDSQTMMGDLEAVKDDDDVETKDESKDDSKDNETETEKQKKKKKGKAG